MSRNLVIFLISIFIFSMPATAKIVDYIAAIVNGEPVLYSEIVKFAKENGIDDLEKARDKVIERKILLTQAQSEGLKVTDKELNAALEDLAKRSGAKNIAEFKKMLQSQGISFEDLKENLKEQLLIAKLIARDVKSKINVSDVEIQKICSSLKSHPVRTVYYIYTKSKEKAQKALELLKQGVPFEKVAKELSEDPTTAQNGGYVGKVTKGSLIKPLDIAVWSTKPGTYKLVETKNGYYIVFVKSQETPSCNEEEIRRRLFVQKFQKALKDYIDNLKRTASVKVYM
ncbi:peptidyl-prolyl cis-trans isomerase SurA [Desulfurobacterium pacificum]|uniref:Peptidyl-prolyl cis-trans isomerase SurA n=1 Tax=Desulfurobacterium pacificum TaxID=240166 RepID=A0ABY1NSN9_9BACT|nr:peptidylprolyl isomerase [Desulfurobacterium pacificum]SMP17188.1 peptidyl-prolyl cis-trans isomerase SurA [Desulfurobacterium pacificum]